MATNRKATAAVASALLAAAVGGGVASRALIGSDAAGTARSARVNAAVQNAKSPVPFLGPYGMNQKGMAECGPGVKLMEQALTRTVPPVRKAKPANCIGSATVKQIKAFQKRHHLPQSGIYGKRTHVALSPRYGPEMRFALVKLATARRDALRRSTILVVTAHAKAHEGLMHYCGSNGYNGDLEHCYQRANWPAWPGVPQQTDCSGYASWVLFQAAGINPNGIGVGTTKTLINHGIPIGLNGPLKIGDLIFYGSNSHVAIYIGHGLVSSHGKPGIDVRPFGYRPIYGIRRYF